MKELGYGEEYNHDFLNNFADQEFYLMVQNTAFYVPEIIQKINTTR
jgi:hypothetical protein